MKKIYMILLSLLFCYSVASNYCVYDAQGNCVEIIQNNHFIEKIKKNKGHKKYYIALSKNEEDNNRQTYISDSFVKSKEKNVGMK